MVETDLRRGLVQAIKEKAASKSVKFGYLIAIVPPLAYWAYWVAHPSIWFNADPAATYFLDSLSVFAGGTYTFVDHPGTPLHLIGSFLLALTYPFFESREAFINFHLSRPSVFFFLVNTFLLTMNIGCVIVFYRTAVSVLEQDRMLTGVAIATLYFALHPYSFPSLTFWSHNSFNFPIGTLWMLWLYNELRKEAIPGPQTLWLLGLAAGMFAVAQIYFTIWLVSGVLTIFVFAIRGGQTFRGALGSSSSMALGGVAGMALMFLPIYKELPRFLGWLTANITHQGLYGSGETGIYSLAMIPAALQYWWLSIRSMVLLLAFTLMVLGIFVAWYRRSAEKLSPSLFAMLCGVLALTGMILFVMSKVVLRLRFSLSLAATLPVLILILLQMLESTPWRIQALQRVFSLTCVIAVGFILVQQIEQQQRRSLVEADAPIAKAQALRRLAREMNVPEDQIRVVYAFSVPLKCPSLLLASIWEGSFEKELGQMCPNQSVILDAAENLDSDFLTARPIPDIQDLDWDLVVWPGNSSHLPVYLESIGAITIPDSWHVRRNKWFYIHSDVLKK